MQHCPPQRIQRDRIRSHGRQMSLLSACWCWRSVHARRHINLSFDVQTPPKVFAGRDASGEFASPVSIPEIMDNKLPTLLEKARELGLTDSVWDMTLRCWHQDSARRPTMIDVVRLLRQWSVFSFPTLNPRCDTLPVVSCYML